MAGEVGVAYVALMPSMDRFNAAVRNSLKSDDPLKGFGDSGGDHGRKAGDDAGRGFISSIKSHLGNMEGIGLANIATAAASFSAKGAATVVSAFASAGTEAGRLAVEGIKASFSAVGNVMRSVATSQITSAGHALGINLGEGVTSGLSSMKVAIGNVVSGIISSVASTVSSSMGTAIQRLDTIKNFPRIMSNLGISEEASAASIQALSDSIDGLPTSLDSLVSFAQKIVPMFDGDMDAATKSAIAFNNAIVAGGRDVTLQANAMEQWSQMMAAGKVDMAAWRSVVNAMPAQMNQVAKAMGKSSTQELYESLVGSKSGTIPLTELNDAFVRLSEEGLGEYASFAEQARVATNGIGTAITNVRNRVAKALASILDWVGQENISGFINNISSQFGPAAKALTDALDAIGARDWLSTLGTTLAGGLKAVVDAATPLRDALSPLLEAAMPAALTLIDGIVQSIAERSGPLMQAVADVVGRATENLPTISGWVADIAESFVNVKFDTWTAALSMWEKVAYATLPIIPQVIEASGTVAVAVAQLVGDLAGTIAPVVADLCTTTANLVAYCTPFVERVVTALVPVFEEIERQIAMFVEGAAPIIADVAERSAPFLAQTMATVGEIVSETFETMAPHLPHIMEAIARVAEALLPSVERILDAIDPYIDPIVDLFAKSAELLAPAIAEVFEILAPHIPTLISLVEKVVDFVAKWLPPLAQTVGRIVEAVAPIIEDIIDIADYWMPHILNVIDIISGALKWLESNVIDPILDAFGAIGDWMDSLPSIDMSFLWPDEGHFATGGIVTGPTHALIGEAGHPEAVVPLTAEGISQFVGGLAGRYQGTATPTVNVNIGTFVNNDTATDVRTLSDEIGRDTIRQLRMQGVMA